MKNKIQESRWMIIYGNGQGLKDIEYLTDSEYKTYVEAVSKQDKQIILKDGRLLPTYGRVTQNPDYFPADIKQKLQAAIIERDKKLAEKRDKSLFEDFLDKKND